MAEAAGAWLVPDGARSLMSVLEELPELFGQMASGMHELAGFMESQGGATLEDAGAGMHEAAGLAGTLSDVTSDIFLQVREDAGFWLDG